MGLRDFELTKFPVPIHRYAERCRTGTNSLPGGRNVSYPAMRRSGGAEARTAHGDANAWLSLSAGRSRATMWTL